MRFGKETRKRISLLIYRYIRVFVAQVRFIQTIQIILIIFQTFCLIYWFIVLIIFGIFTQNRLTYSKLHISNCLQLKCPKLLTNTYVINSDIVSLANEITNRIQKMMRNHFSFTIFNWQMNVTFGSNKSGSLLSINFFGEYFSMAAHSPSFITAYPLNTILRFEIFVNMKVRTSLYQCQIVMFAHFELEKIRNVSVEWNLWN